MYRTKFCRVSVPVVGALGMFVLVCVLGTTAEAFDTPTVKPPATAQPPEVEQSMETEVGSVAAPVKVLRPTEPRRTAMGGPPANNDCADAIVILDGNTDFSTTGASTDGPDLAGFCDPGAFGDDIIHTDVWYNYTATCNGNLRVTTCEELGGSATYDTRLAVYNGVGCPADAADVLACNDDDASNPCGATPDFHSTLLATGIVMGNVYKIQIGGFAEADNGTGSVLLECVPCGNDICEPGLGEDCLTCPEDCADDVCAFGDNCGNCPADCGECACNGGFPGDCDDGQIGIQGAFLHNFPIDGSGGFAACWDLDGDTVCDLDTEDADADGDCDAADCSWAGLAFPFIVEGTSVDTVRVSLNTNRSGGDIFITGSATGVGGVCQPNVLDIRRSLGCALSGLDTNVEHDLHFESIDGLTPGDTLWVVLRGRSGNSGSDGLDADEDDFGFYNGQAFPAHQVGRSVINESLPNNSFANLAGTGNVGDWSDLNGLLDADGFGLGTFYCVSLTAEFMDPDVFCDDDSEDPNGACCGLAGLTCELMRGFECGDAGGAYLGDGSTCDDCNSACNDATGDCCVGHGGLGCNDITCCEFVCELDPICCDKEWDSACASDANDIDFGCGQIGEVCEPTQCVEATAESIPECIKTGSDDFNALDGFLGIVTDEYGAHACAAPCFGGGNDECNFGDNYNPAGPLPTDEPIFGAALFWYKTDTSQRVVLSDVPNHDTTYVQDFSGFAEIPEGGENVASDTNDDGVNDTLNSAFSVCGPNDVSLEFTLEQHVERFVPLGGAPVAVWTQVYHITNVSATAIEFVLARQDDQDMFWVGNNADDCVGTETNQTCGTCPADTFGGGPNADEPDGEVGAADLGFLLGKWGPLGPDPDPRAACLVIDDDDDIGAIELGNVLGAWGPCPLGLGGGPDLSVFIMECDEPSTAITLSSPQASTYWGGKGGVDPDEDGPGPAYGCGTDFQQWDAFGVPEGWANHIANVGTNINGISGPDIPAGCTGGCICDGSIGITIDVSLAPAESTCVCIQHTYGSTTPWMGGTCPEGCN